MPSTREHDPKCGKFKLSDIHHEHKLKIYIFSGECLRISVDINKTLKIQFMMEVDSEYFKSYQDLDIHQLMLEDRVRNEAYRSAIMSNLEKFKVNF